MTVRLSFFSIVLVLVCTDLIVCAHGCAQRYMPPQGRWGPHYLTLLFSGLQVAKGTPVLRDCSGSFPENPLRSGNTPSSPKQQIWSRNMSDEMIREGLNRSAAQPDYCLWEKWVSTWKLCTHKTSVNSCWPTTCHCNFWYLNAFADT